MAPDGKLNATKEQSEFIEIPVTQYLCVEILFIHAITMSSTAKAPSQFKQPSRKGKKAWRKNVDTTEIVTGLENLREEEIRGCDCPLSQAYRTAY